MARAGVLTHLSGQLLRFFRVGRVPFLGPVPALVLFFGLLATLAITSIGVVQLKVRSDEAASLRSQLLARTLAERLAGVGRRGQRQLIERAAVRSRAEILLVNRAGKILSDGAVKPPSPEGIRQLLRVGSGETETSVGHARFHAASLPGSNDAQSVLVFAPAPRRPVAAESLVQLVGAFSVILLGAAALVAFTFAKDVQLDVEYVKRRIVDIADSGAPLGAPVLVRSVDQLGSLTCAFNELVERFADAENGYKEDLKLAAAIERDRSAFLAALSHELKTPLNVILGFSDVLLAEVEGPLSQEARENLEVVHRSGQHLKTLIKDILDLSALESGELTLSREHFDIHSVCTDVCKEYRVTAAAKGLHLQLDSTPLLVWADPTRVRQMLGNLVGNAVKFTQRGEIRITTQQRGEQVTLSVADTGPGIAPQEQSSIFNDYAQAGDTAARGAGSGLGLAITRRLVVMHGGHIDVESELGRGATFTIWLPREPSGERRSRRKVEPTPVDNVS